MHTRWILYIIIAAVLAGVALGGAAASRSDDAAQRAADLAADYRTLAESAATLSMTAGEIIIEARLPIRGDDTLASITLPPDAETALVSDRCHDTRWLYITCPSCPDDVYVDTLAILSALDSPDAVGLSLNTSWHTTARYSTAEKKELIDSLLASVDARTTAYMEDERMVSASGYSRLLHNSVGEGSDSMNITASLCTNPTQEGSVLWLGTPVLTVEY